jgi:hypothetical protein
VRSFVNPCSFLRDLTLSAQPFADPRMIGGSARNFLARIAKLAFESKSNAMGAAFAWD